RGCAAAADRLRSLSVGRPARGADIASCIVFMSASLYRSSRLSAALSAQARLKLDPVEIEQVLVARSHDPVAFAKTFEHLDALRVAPSEADGLPHSAAAVRIDDEHPAAPGIVVKRAVRDDQGIGRLADVEPHTDRLAAADESGRRVEKRELDFELALANVRVDLGDLELMSLARELEGRDLPERHAGQIELVDERRDLERAELVDLPDALARPLRLADVRFEQRELTSDRCGDHEVLEVLSCDAEVQVHRLDRFLQPLDLRRLKLLVDPLRLEHRVAQRPAIGELGLEVVELAARRAAGADERLALRDVPLEQVDLVVELDQLAAMPEPVLLEGQARAAQIVELLGQLRFAADDLELQVRVLQPDERRPGLDDGAGLDVDLDDLAALDRVEKHRRARHDVAGDRDVFAKRAVGDGRERQPCWVDAERAIQPV